MPLGKTANALLALPGQVNPVGPTYAAGTQVSPLVASYGEWQMAGRQAPALPRPFNTFSAGAFGPGVPIWPMPIDVVSEESDEPLPRRMQYPVYWNLPVGIPGTEGLKLTNFYTLRSYADLSSIARACVDTRIHEIIGMGWDIAPTKSKERAMRGDVAARTEWERRKLEMVDFWERPDRSVDSPYRTWSEFMTALCEDMIVCDAVALYLHPARRKGHGWFNSDLGSLDLLDGTTIRPLLDIRGGVPQPPAVAFQQFIWGVPRVDLRTVSEGLDLNELGEQVDEFKASEMIYLKMTSRSWTPYGFSAIEKAILPISISYARQVTQLEWFTEGSVPYLYVVPGEQLIQSPAQIQQLQNALNNFAGDTGWKQKIIVLPPGSRAEPIKPNDLASQFDEWITSSITMAFGLTPLDLGLAPKVAAVQSPAMSNMMAKAAAAGSSSHWLTPVLHWLKRTVFDYVIKDVLGQEDMEWQWSGLETPDETEQSIANSIQLVTHGLGTIDEERIKLGNDPFGLSETSVPLVFTATGATTLTASVNAAAATLTESTLTASPAQPETPAAHSSSLPSDPDEMTTPAHDAAETIEAKVRELTTLQKYLTNGRDISKFTPAALSAADLQLVKRHLPNIHEGIGAARLRVRAQRLQANMDRTLAPLKREVVTQMSQHARQLKEGAISTATFTDLVLALLRKNWRLAHAAGARAASRELSIQPVKLSPAADVARDRDEDQYKLLLTFATDILALTVTTATAAALSARIAGYSHTLDPAYQQGYGETAEAAMSDSQQLSGGATAAGDRDYRYLWHAEEGACELCEPRDMRAYSPSELPCWPGDGGWGEFCMGSHNCRCFLTLHEVDELQQLLPSSLPPSVNTLRGTAEPTPSMTQQEWLAWREQLRDRFVSDMPAVTPSDELFSAQQRAVIRDNVRDQLAAERGVEPSEVPAADVARRLPPGITSKPTPSQLAAGAPAWSNALMSPRWVGKILPPAASIAMVALDTGNVLLQQRAGDGELTGTWEFPGGHLDAGESPLEAALREFTEEVGAAVPTDARTVNSFDMAGWRCFVVEVPRQAEVVPGSLPQSGDVPAQIRWLAPRDALQLNLRPELVNAPWQLIGRLGKGTGLVTTVPGTLEDHVFGLLLRHYPPTDLQWVRECDWQEDHHVRLAQIDMAHRPGGRDMKRVESMTQAIEHGFEPPAIVLVKAGDEYKIADGYHRSDALKTAGIEYTAAYVGIPRSGGKHIGKWLTEMQYDASNKPSKK